MHCTVRAHFPFASIPHQLGDAAHAALALACLLQPSAASAAQQTSPSSAEFAEFAANNGAEEPAPNGLTSIDWGEIRAAYSAHRHAVLRCGSRFQAENPGREWSVLFDGRGWDVRPGSGDWSWGLDLESYGFVRSTRMTTLPICTASEGARVTYDWDGNLEEWFENRDSGIEHGFLLQERPKGPAEGPLVLSLSIRGGLTPHAQSDGRGIEFQSSSGAHVLTYAGLHVYDADGKEVPARLEGRKGQVDIVIEEGDARYPLTVDPVLEAALLKAPNFQNGDGFGRSVAVWSNTVVVGVPFEDSNGSSWLDNTMSNAGAVFVFRKMGGVWTQVGYLKAVTPSVDDRLGSSVAVTGNSGGITVLAGANDDSGATSVYGDDLDTSAPGSGAAYVFIGLPNGTNWSQQAYLKPHNTGAGDDFGFQVAVWNNTAVVSAINEGSSISGIFQAPFGSIGTDNTLVGNGAVYVFHRAGPPITGIWSQQAYIKPSNADSGPQGNEADNFGIGLSLSGATLVVGSPGEDTGTLDSGAAYVFMGTFGLWSQQQMLKASNPGIRDHFGWSVGVTGYTKQATAGTIVVGASTEDGPGEATLDSGAAYVFVRTPPIATGTWSEQEYLRASNADAGDAFGDAVAISGDSIVVGARREGSNSNTIDSGSSDNSASEAGAAYVFRRTGTAWTQQAYLKASNGDAFDRFGETVAIWGRNVVVGASKEDSIFNNSSDNSFPDSGAAYVFDISSLLPPPGSWWQANGPPPRAQ